METPRFVNSTAGQHDRHHILHERKEWSLRPQARSIRETPTLVPTIPRTIHNEIHRECPAIPLLGYYSLARVYSDFVPGDDTFSSMDNLMLSIDKAARAERAHPIERELAELVIEAIDLQRPFLKEAL